MAGEVSWSVRGGRPALLGFYWLLVEAACDSTRPHWRLAVMLMRGYAGAEHPLFLFLADALLGLGDVGRTRTEEQVPGDMVRQIAGM